MWQSEAEICLLKGFFYETDFFFLLFKLFRSIFTLLVVSF